MAKEIERKYLIDIEKLGSLSNGVLIKQGYILTRDNTAVRARLAGDKAYLTLKGKNDGISRSEFEYEIPVQDAHDIIAELCRGATVEKTRYLVVFGDHTWEVDVFHGDNDGLVVAELELAAADEKFELPPWALTEVSDDARYYNSSLLETPFKSW